MYRLNIKAEHHEIQLIVQQPCVCIAFLGEVFGKSVKHMLNGLLHSAHACMSTELKLCIHTVDVRGTLAHE
jgi:hypothetical protein